MPLIRLFFDICLFRKGPQDAPASTILLKICLGAYVMVGMVLMILEARWQEAMLQVILEGAMLLGFIWISLKAAGKMNRFLQTTIAMTGADALISCFAIPLVVVVTANPQAYLVHLLLLMLILWHIAVVAHILRHALSQSLGIALGLAIVYVIFSYQVMVLLFVQSNPSS